MEIIQYLDGFGVVGVLIWLMLYVFKSLIPNMRKEYAESLKASQEAAIVTQKEQREAFDKLLTEQRDAFDALVVRQRDDFKNLMADQREKELEFAGKLGQTLEGLTGKTEELAVIILAHDLTVRGVNPEVVGSTEDIVQGSGVSASLMSLARARAKVRSPAGTSSPKPPAFGPKTRETLVKILRSDPSLAKEVKGE